MFLKLSHQKLDIYTTSLKFVVTCYKIANVLPAEEKFAMAAQIRRAALSVHLNIAEGSSRKSAVKRRRFYEISRASVVEVDAALDVANELGYLKNISFQNLEEYMVRCFKMLTGLMDS